MARLDRDVAAGAKSEKVMDRMRRGEIDVLVGTQMVTKGHDLPNVTLVGVLNADAALSMPDFRAAERSFHLLVQVAGRAGRAERPGRVLIQTRQPGHAAIRFAQQHDVRGFIQAELELRRELRTRRFRGSRWFASTPSTKRSLERSPSGSLESRCAPRSLPCKSWGPRRRR